MNGHQVEGRFIGPEAYAAYLQGSYEEGRDNPSGALAWYRRALALDPESPELWTRVGSIQCRNGTVDVKQAFDEARALAPEYAAIWIEMANCEVVRGKIAEALPDALRGAALAPYDEEATSLLIRIYELLGRSPDAERWRTAWRLLQTPRTEQVPEAPATKLEADQMLSDIDAALDAGELKRARTLAVRARLSAGELAARAASRGKAEVALEQAVIVLRADPSNADAWVGAVVAADLLANDDLFRQWLLRVPEDAVPASALSVAALTNLLERRVGIAAAQAWKSSAGTP
jgi:tetratricopeptide (TPR) repeat protein